MKFISANDFSFFSVVKTLSRLIPAMNRIEKRRKAITLSVELITSLTNCFLSHHETKTYNVTAKRLAAVFNLN